MNRLWLFNPENDIALANGTANFTAPPAAVEIRRAGELLPFFLGHSGDATICGGVNERWFNSFRDRFEIKSDVWNHSIDGYMPSPWGWSAAAKRYFLNLGFSAEVLPTDAQLETYRALSHRRTAAVVGDLVAGKSAADPLRLWPRAREFDSAESLRSYLSTSGKVVVKQPWSSSGRGVRVFDRALNNLDNFISQTTGAMRRQGSVTVEEFMEGHTDFALLFECSDGRAAFVGPSLFIANETDGRYMGNLVATDDYIFDEIYRNVDPDVVSALINRLREALAEAIAGEYSGPVGVDICAAGGFVHICEVNLRYTMGFVARGIAAHTDSPSMLSVGPDVPDGAGALTPPGNKMYFRLSEL